MVVICSVCIGPAPSKRPWMQIVEGALETPLDGKGSSLVVCGTLLCLAPAVSSHL